MRLLPAALAALLAVGALAATMTRPLMHWPDLLDRPRPAPTRTIRYGPDPLQHVDLWLPAGRPPFPVVLMVHGGCWTTSVAKADIMNYIADDLAKRGVAVWNVEYRGVDTGGGYPGTFQDVAAAADLLAADGPKLGLRVTRVVAFGHSAGGHLALWLAARERLPKGSPLAAPHPLRLAHAISAGGLPDLEAATTPPGDTCGPEAPRAMAGPASAARPDPFSDTSPAAMLPFATPQTLVNATRDAIAPPAFADAYAAKARKAGMQVARVTVANEGHVELIAPGTKAWAAEVRVIERALGR